MNLQEIKEHWEHAGTFLSDESSITPVSRDPYLAALERRNILSYLNSDDSVLEIGCGNASHTICYAKRVRHLTAVDVAESLVDLAMQKLSNSGTTNVTINNGSVLDLENMYTKEYFDCAISQRCLINLPSWEYQQRALLQISRVLKQGGLLLLTEGFVEGLKCLNDARKAVGLGEIAVVDYNRYFQRKPFETFVHRHFDIVEIRDYGAYLFLSRVFHPLAVSPADPAHDSPLNRTAMEISMAIPMPDLAKHSYNLFYALRRK